MLSINAANFTVVSLNNLITPTIAPEKRSLDMTPPTYNRQVLSETAGGINMLKKMTPNYFQKNNLKKRTLLWGAIVENRNFWFWGRGSFRVSFRFLRRDK